MAIDYASQADIVQALSSIFPEFASEWAEECVGGVPPSDSAHVVYMTLMPLLGKIDMSEKQARQFAGLVNDAVAAGGVAENAVATCLLEHFRGSSAFRKVRPYLSKDAKLRLSAHFVSP